MKALQLKTQYLCTLVMARLMSSRVYVTLAPLLMGVAIFLFATLAFAQTVVPDATPPVLDFTDPVKVLTIILGAAVSKDWGVLICAAIVGVIGLSKKFIPAHTAVGKALRTKVGGWATNFAMSAGVTLLASLLGKIPLSLSSVMAAVTTGLGAAGAFELWHDVTAKKDDGAAKAAGAAAAANPGPTLNG